MCQVDGSVIDIVYATPPYCFYLVAILDPVLESIVNVGTGIEDAGRQLSG